MKKLLALIGMGFLTMQIFADGGRFRSVKVLGGESCGIVTETNGDLCIVSETNSGDLTVIVLDATGTQVNLKVVYNSTTGQASFAPNQFITPQMYTVIITNNKTKAVRIFRIQVL